MPSAKDLTDLANLPANAYYQYILAVIVGYLVVSDIVCKY